MKQYKKSGFTIIEIIVVIAIVSILAIITIPIYNKHQLRSKRHEAITVLTTIYLDQEQYYLKNNVYAQNISELPVNDSKINNDYDISIENISDEGFTVVAKAIDSQKKDTSNGISCEILKIIIDKSDTQQTPKECWQ